jgi:hypothetical protein
MTVGPFDIGLVIARLAAQVPAFKFVQGAAELAVAMKAGGAPQTPCAYVLLAAERARGATYGTSEAHVQTIDTTVNVVLALRNYRTSQLGAQVKDDLKTLISATRGALLGWGPMAQASGFDFAGGRLEDYNDATVWWNEAYNVNYFERVIPQ